MAFHITSIFGGLAKTGLFRVFSKYFYPELMMVALYAVLWVDPALLGEKGFQGLSIGLWLEFAIAHAKTGLGVVSVVFPPNKTSGKFAIGCVGVFYFLFVGGLCFVTGNVITAIAFVLLCIKRIAGYHGDEQVVKEIGFSFARVMWLMIASALGYVVALALPAEIENLPGEKGAEMVPAWGVVYFTGLHFFERYVTQIVTNKAKK
jgi:hypothetical protein